MNEKKYSIIYADPPWHYSSRSHQDSGRGFSDLKPYPTLNQDSLKKMGGAVSEISETNAACFMWVTDSHLKEGIQLLESWGFQYKTIAFVWIKNYKSGRRCVNFAPWTLKSSEICLLGIRGKMSQHKISNNVYQLVEAERTSHSKKPDQVRDRIVQLFGDIPRVELFARQASTGWDVWGNEIPNDIELHSPTK